MVEMPRIVDFEDPTFDPFLADDLVYGAEADIHTPLAALRRKASVQEGNYFEILGRPRFSLAREGAKEFVVLGYEALMAGLTDPTTPFLNSAYDNSLRVTFGETISVMDPPDHPRYRKVFQAAFLPRQITAWGAEIVDPVVSRLMDGFLPNKKADLVDEFTRHYPFQVIYGQLDLPAQATRTFHKLAVAQLLFGGGAFIERAKEAATNLGAYFQAMVELRRREPGADLVSLLVQAEADGERLPEHVIISFLRQLINAGGDTTFRGTSVLLTGLLQNPEQLDAVRADRSLVPQAIEEAIRWEPPVTYVPREAARDTVLDGVEIPKGAYVEFFAAAANRDESVFENPDQFDIFRKKVRHFGFGTGPHICIGQHLARLEMTRALNAILDRLPNLRLDPDMPAPVIRGATLRYPKHLHVLFD